MHGIVAQHGGRALMESRMDEGTIEPVPMAGGPSEIALVTLMVALGVLAVLNRERRQSLN